MPVPDHVIAYALRLVRATRVKEPMDAGIRRGPQIKDYLSWGAGPRASEYLVLAAKAKAALSGARTSRPST
jgi:MoxR-like ATPase